MHPIFDPFRFKENGSGLSVLRGLPWRRLTVSTSLDRDTKLCNVLSPAATDWGAISSTLYVVIILGPSHMSLLLFISHGCHDDSCRLDRFLVLGCSSGESVRWSRTLMRWMLWCLTVGLYPPGSSVNGDWDPDNPRISDNKIYRYNWPYWPCPSIFYFDRYKQTAAITLGPNSQYVIMYRSSVGDFF